MEWEEILVYWDVDYGSVIPLKMTTKFKPMAPPYDRDPSHCLYWEDWDRLVQRTSSSVLGRAAQEIPTVGGQALNFIWFRTYFSSGQQQIYNLSDLVIMSSLLAAKVNKIRPKQTEGKATVTQSTMVCPLICLGLDTPSGYQTFQESSASTALEFQGNNTLKPEKSLLWAHYTDRYSRSKAELIQLFCNKRLYLGKKMVLIKTYLWNILQILVLI